ncbi:MAG: energy transducer TonB [Bacteroidales bacterium]|nr:energy transducer TonB [Bacteroidales bacterium]
MLDSHQIEKSINHLSDKGFSSTNTPTMFRGGGIGSGSGGGFGSGLGPGEGGGHGGGIGYGTGSRGMINNISTTVNEEGQVCVEVHVTEEGSVISARVINTSKFRTTINNSAIQAQCIAQAKQARYKPGKEELRVIIFK